MSAKSNPFDRNMEHFDSIFAALAQKNCHNVTSALIYSPFCMPTVIYYRPAGPLNGKKLAAPPGKRDRRTK